MSSGDEGLRNKRKGPLNLSVSEHRTTLNNLFAKHLSIIGIKHQRCMEQSERMRTNENYCVMKICIMELSSFTVNGKQQHKLFIRKTISELFSSLFPSPHKYDSLSHNFWGLKSSKKKKNSKQNLHFPMTLNLLYSNCFANLCILGSWQIS